MVKKATGSGRGKVFGGRNKGVKMNTLKTMLRIQKSRAAGVPYRRGKKPISK